MLHQAVIGNRKKIGHNDPCPCGSGETFKKCCLLNNTDSPSIAEIVAKATRDDQMQSVVDKVAVA